MPTATPRRAAGAVTTLTAVQKLHARLVISGHPPPSISVRVLPLLLPHLLPSPSPRTLSHFRTILLSHPSPSTQDLNLAIRGASRRHPALCFSFFSLLLRLGLSPNYLTFPFVARAAARLTDPLLALAVHSQAARRGLVLGDVFVSNSFVHMHAACGAMDFARAVFDGMIVRNLVSWNSLLDGYAKCGDMESAREVFDGMVERDVVSWSAIIDGYVKAGEHKEAVKLFQAMEKKGNGVCANEVTMVSVLCACAHLGDLTRGRHVHQCLVENNVQIELPLATALVDMYAKCGVIQEAIAVFRSVPVDKTDVLLWNAVIGGLAVHGMGKECVKMFDEMRYANIVPDEITYLALLSACAHGGLVNEAQDFFRLLDAQGLMVHVEHYACLIDALCRSGKLEEAYQVFKTMPMEPSPTVLGAMLNACRIHGWVELGVAIGKQLVELEPHHDGRYIGLSNIYAIGKKWQDAKMTRKIMEDKGVTKVPGFSAIDVDGRFWRFIMQDETHPESARICQMLGLVTSELKLEADCSIKEVLSEYSEFMH